LRVAQLRRHSQPSWIRGDTSLNGKYRRNIGSRGGDPDRTGRGGAANPVYTGEAQWSGGAYLQLGDGSGLSWTIPAADQPRLLQAVVNRVPGPAGASLFATSGTWLGDVRYGGGCVRR
jgi:hypothetical protein